MSLTIRLNDPTATYPKDSLYWGNITHNLGDMADAAGIYKAMWRPEEIGASKAREISDILYKGLKELKGNRLKYEKFNSPNGWGLYEHFVPFVEEYLNACLEYPEAIVEVCR